MAKEAQQSPGETIAWLLDDLQTNGVRAAYSALLDVCRDPKAPAPAKATAGVALLRAAGVFAAGDDAKSKKEPHEMTAEELAADIADLKRRQRQIERGGATADDGGDVFR